ncbi:Chromosome segregation ATPase-like protein (plasmid) [Methanohalobium evestigatum Z-7303]|uniref:Chromosome segregation ATPase-like protein n=2 Tax=Methanohalobium evestigatum TaxID=2322 RepID=D7EC55_METEZ|nr:Chromosome segregation ATPase-like protein [Methanohalobium evestigatum Z-7303]
MSSNFSQLDISLKNVGGLKEKNLTVKSGLNIIEAPNASGKTSLLRGFLLSVLPNGKANHYSYLLHSKSNFGSVKITDANGQEYTKEIVKDKNSVSIKGDNIVDPEKENLVSRFTIAGNTNKILDAVRTGQNLKDILLEYTNIPDLKNQLSKYDSQIKDNENQLNTLENKLKNETELYKNLSITRNEIEKLDEEKSKLEKEYTAKKIDDETNKEYKEAVNKLNKIQQSIKELENKINYNKKRYKELEETKQKYENDLEQVQHNENIDVNTLENEIKNINEKIDSNISKMKTLNTYIDGIDEFINSSLDIADVQGNNSIDSLAESLNCPFCGTNCDKSKLEEQKSHLTSIRDSLKEENKSLKQKSSEKQELIDSYKKKENEINKINSKIIDTENLISETNEQIKKAQNKLRDIKQQKIEQEDIVSKFKEEVETETADITNRLSKVNAQLESYKNKEDQINKSIENNRLNKEKYDELKTKIDDLNDKRSNLQKKINNIEQNVRENFNNHIKEVYDELGFENIDNIELSSDYNLYITRTSDEGKGYFDRYSIMTLSTSELEVIGLIVMLSGYLTYKVNEVFPVIVLDELTYLDTKRMNDLMDYMSDKVESVVLTKLPSGTLNTNANLQKLESLSTTA